MTEETNVKYRSKPSEIEAIQWTGFNWSEVHEFAGNDPVKTASTSDSGNELPLQLLAGKDGAQEWVPVPAGHWLVNQPGDKSDIWPVDPDYFVAKYEPVQP